jgi:hypothetical protein
MGDRQYRHEQRHNLYVHIHHVLPPEFSAPVFPFDRGAPHIDLEKYIFSLFENGTAPCHLHHHPITGAAPRQTEKSID